MHSRLAFQGQVQQLFAEDFTDIQTQVFDLSKFGAPGRTLRAIELVSQVFRNTLEVGPYIVYFLGALLFSRHPWLLSGLASKNESNFPPIVYECQRQLQTMSCTPVELSGCLTLARG